MKQKEKTSKKKKRPQKGEKNNFYGKYHTEETKRKISEKLKRRPVSKETREKIGKRHKGKTISNESKRKMSKAHKGKISPMKGKHHSEETKRKISNSNKGNIAWNKGKKITTNTGRTHFKKGQSSAFKGRHHSEETKKVISKKLRIASFNYVKKMRDILYPCIGHNEKKILDKLEKKIGYKIKRQFKCEGYFIDGYIEKLRLAIEVDEIPKNREKDIEREKIIKEKLGCSFLRVKDYD